MSELMIDNCALCGGVAWLQREHGEEFLGPNGPQIGTARYIRCAGSDGPVNPETGEFDASGDWKAWKECDPDDCTTYDEQHGGAYQAGEEPCILKWNAMHASIIEARELEGATKPALDSAPKTTTKGRL